MWTCVGCARRLRGTMPRVLLLLFALSGMTLVFIAKCGLNFDAAADLVQHENILSVQVLRSTTPCINAPKHTPGP